MRLKLVNRMQAWVVTSLPAIQQEPRRCYPCASRPSMDSMVVLFNLPDFWKGALFTRESIITIADRASSPDAETMYRSEIIIAGLKGEEPQAMKRPDPWTPEERAWHVDAVDRIKILLEIAEAEIEDVTLRPEFERWHSPSGLLSRTPISNELRINN